MKGIWLQEKFVGGEFLGEKYKKSLWVESFWLQEKFVGGEFLGEKYMAARKVCGWRVPG